LRRLEGEMRAALDDGDVVEWQRLADVRYRGQNWSIPVEWPGELDEEGLAALVERFEDAHEQLYGTRLEEGSPVDVRALRLIALGPERDDFRLEHEARPVAGPLLIDEYDTTVVVPPGWEIALDAVTGALVLTAVSVEPVAVEGHEA